MNLITLLEKLKEKGYHVGIKKFDNQDYIFGGIQISDGVLKLGCEIRVTIENEKLYFIDSIGQTYKKIKFNSQSELISFITEKFPIEH